MCGIAGLVNFDGRVMDLDLLVRMTKTIVHRGPDEEGYFVNGPSFINKQTRLEGVAVRSSSGNGVVSKCIMFIESSIILIS